MVTLRGNNVNIQDYLGLPNRLQVVWGIGLAEYAVNEFDRIDYFVDKKADQISRISGIDVISSDGLYELFMNTKLPITIVILTMPRFPDGTVHQIFDEIYSLDIDADVFNYWGNIGYFSNRSFAYKGKYYELFEHPYNCFTHDVRMSERGVEVSLMKSWIDEINSDVVEIGAVSPYYFSDSRIVEVIDPADRHIKVTRHCSVFDVDLNGKNVLCISTLEHIGTGEYGLEEKENPINALNKILQESNHCLISFPYGYNEELDGWVEKNCTNDYFTIMVRGLSNEWREKDFSATTPYRYKCAPLYAFGLIIIEK